MVIPAVHDAANDAPLTYTPACGHANGVPVCLNPAYRRWLPDVTAALAPVLAEVAGLPGAPVRATQVAAAYSSGESGPPQAITLTRRSATPWVWPARPPHDRGGAICACLVITAGLLLITVRGQREPGREPDPAS